MLSIAYYFLQVILCSGMLMGYYWLVLRNKRFHQYNRFYLLAVALLSWAVPLVKITWYRPVSAEDQPQMMNLLSVVADNNSQIESSLQRNGFAWSREWLMGGLYLAVSLALLAGMIHAFVKLYRLLRSHSCRNVGDVFLILTHAKGTPFSFFRYIFWNEEIDIRSESGRQILQHELTHVQQKHSFDKIFIQLVLVGGWFNPFFWLLKREMEMIHEFIADKKAVHNGDTAALAQMLLTAAYPQQKFALTHPFFFSPIKRRLSMLANNRNPRFSYIRRLVVLPLLAVVVVLFAFRSAGQRASGELSVASIVENYQEDISHAFAPKTDETAPDLALLKGTRIPVETVRLNELRFAPYLLQLQEEKRLSGDTTPVKLWPTPATVPAPLFLVNGKKLPEAQLHTIDPNSIESITVFKDATAVAIYGESAAHGVVSITLKPTVENSITMTYEDGRFSFPTISGTAVDAFNNLARNHAVIVKETVYQGEEKTRIIEEVHGTTTNSEGVFAVKIGSGRQLSGSKTPAEIDLSKGPFFVNIKAAVTSTGEATGGEHFVDRGFIQLVLNDANPVKQPDPAGGVVTWRDLSDGKGLTLKSTSGSVSGMEVKPQTDKSTADNVQEAELGEVVVIGYGTQSPASSPQGKTPASFPGGKTAWDRYLMRNLNRDILKNNKAPFGKYSVVVSFVVGRDGSISEVKAQNDPGYGTAAEAERIIAKGPHWVPAMDEKGQPMLYRQKQTISFVYADDTKQSLNPQEPQLESVTVRASSVPKLTGTIRGGTFSGTLGGGGRGANPSFPGGTQAWQQYLQRNLDAELPARNGAPPGKYTVMVRFTVEDDGSVRSITADNDPGYGMKDEALRIIRKSPKWTPGNVNGTAVTMRFGIPVYFEVSDKKAELNNLLKKLPSVTIEPNGKVAVQGQAASRIVVDGQVMNRP